MEIIEKQVEKVKEVPADGYYGYGYGRAQELLVVLLQLLKVRG